MALPTFSIGKVQTVRDNSSTFLSQRRPTSTSGRHAPTNQKHAGPAPMILPFGISVRTYARNVQEGVRKFLHRDTRDFPTPPVGLFRSIVPWLRFLPQAPSYGTHYRHYHEFPQLLRLCCTATKMAAGCILPCKEDALLVCSSFYCGACTAGMSCHVIPLDN